MTLLLDTHAILWWLDDNPRLGPEARALIMRRDVRVFASVASLWEISIKHGQGKLRANAALVAGRLPEADIALLPIKVTHLTTLEQLPSLHHDPFDRILLAQALVESAQLMTSDAMIQRYGVACIEAAD